MPDSGSIISLRQRSTPCARGDSKITHIIKHCRAEGPVNINSIIEVPHSSLTSSWCWVVTSFDETKHSVIRNTIALERVYHSPAIFREVTAIIISEDMPFLVISSSPSCEITSVECM